MLSPPCALDDMSCNMSLLDIDSTRRPSTAESQLALSAQSLHSPSTPPVSRALDALFAPHTVTKAELKARMGEVNAELDRTRAELQHAQQIKDDADRVHANHMAAAETEIDVLTAALEKARVDKRELTAITEEAVAELEQHQAARQAEIEQHQAARLAAETPPHLKCPIAMERFRSPVIVSDGHSFERTAIKRWLAAHDTNPVTGARLAHRDLVLNLGLRDASVAWAAEHRPPDEQRADEQRGAWTPSRQVQRVALRGANAAVSRTTGGSAAGDGWLYPSPPGWRPNEWCPWRGVEQEWRRGEGMVDVDDAPLYEANYEHEENPHPNRRELEEQLTRDPDALELYLSEREQAAAARVMLAQARQRAEEEARQRGREARAAAAAGPRDRFGRRLA